jgi:hypothetical protein
VHIQTNYTCILGTLAVFLKLDLWDIVVDLGHLAEVLYTTSAANPLYLLDVLGQEPCYGVLVDLLVLRKGCPQLALVALMLPFLWTCCVVQERSLPPLVPLMLVFLWICCVADE